MLRADVANLSQSEKELGSEVKRLQQEIDVWDEMLRADVDVANLSQSEKELGSGVKRLQQEIDVWDEMLDSIAQGAVVDGDEVGTTDLEASDSFSDYCQGFSAIGKVGVPDRQAKYCFDRHVDPDEIADLKAQFYRNYRSRFSPPLPASRPRMVRSRGWEDLPSISLESMFLLKHFLARRESPWKVDGDLSTITSLMRNQAMRYQFLAQTIDMPENSSQ